MVLPDLFTPKDIEVPDVSGLSLDKAVSELVTAGFVISETKEISHEEIDEGDVVKTDPKAGRVAKKGQKLLFMKVPGRLHSNY